MKTEKIIFPLDIEDRLVQCTECHDIHKWSDRKKIDIQQNPEFGFSEWTIYLCPECGEQNYFPYQTLSKNMTTSEMLQTLFTSTNNLVRRIFTYIIEGRDTVKNKKTVCDSCLNMYKNANGNIALPYCKECEKLR